MFGFCVCVCFALLLLCFVLVLIFLERGGGGVLFCFVCSSLTAVFLHDVVADWLRPVKVDASAKPFT